MPIALENVGIAVRDIEEAIAFFTDLGLTLVGRDEVSGEWADTAVGLDGNHAKIAVLQTPDGQGRLEFFEYLHPDAIETTPTLPNEIGMHRVAFSVDDIDASLEIAARHGFVPLRGVANYQNVYKLTYLRDPRDARAGPDEESPGVGAIAAIRMLSGRGSLAAPAPPRLSRAPEATRRSAPPSRRPSRARARCS